MSKELPMVSVVISMRNEGKFAAECLDSVVMQDYPKDKVEIIVVDGMSTDDTKQIIEQYKRKNPSIKLEVNEKKTTPCAFNLGIKKAKGDAILIMGAHARYQNDYISKCLKYLYEYNADNVGGKMITLPQHNTFIGKAIVNVLTSNFGVGNSDFRTNTNNPKETDTVFGGCYRKEVFEKIGFFNENLIRNQDLDFNLRLKRSGGKIILAPEIVSFYYARSTLRDFCKYNFKDSFWITFPLKFGLYTFSLRHLIPIFFVLGLVTAGILGIFFAPFLLMFIFVVGSYFVVNVYYSVKISFKQKDFRYLFLMPFVFACRHISYGLGSIWGLIKAVFK